MNWIIIKSTAASAGNFEKVMLQWKDFQIGDCYKYTLPLHDGSFNTTKTISNHAVDTEVFWTRFNVTLTAVDSLHKEISKSVTALTSARAPNGSVESFRTTNLRETSVTLQWDPPACLNRGGAVQNYLVNIYEVATGNPPIGGKRFPANEYNLTGLSPGTTYRASIIFENSAAMAGPEASFNFTMAGSSKSFFILSLIGTVFSH